MKRYIRTKDGKIFDTKNETNSIVLRDLNDISKREEAIVSEHFGNICGILKKDIIKQADTIEELIEVGDLVKFGGSGSHRIVSSYYFKPNKERDYTSFKDYEGVIYDTQYITELYTKQGRNYVLVWTKEEGVI